MSEIKTDALERVLAWIDNADLADADDIYGYCRKCHGEIAHKDGCDLPIARAELAALRARVAQGEADSKRLDDLSHWLRDVPGRALRFPREDPHFTLFLQPGEAEDLHRAVMKAGLRGAIDAIPSCGFPCQPESSHA